MRKKNGSTHVLKELNSLIVKWAQQVNTCRTSIPKNDVKKIKVKIHNRITIITK